MTAAAAFATGTVIGTATAVSAGATATFVRRVTRPSNRPARRPGSDGHGNVIADSSPLLPSAQDLSVLRRQCAEDRLQGCQAAAALRVRARQDRAEPPHGGLVQEATRTGAGDQARPFPRALALRHPLTGRHADNAGWARLRPLRWSKRFRAYPGSMVGTDLDPPLTADEAGQLCDDAHRSCRP